MNIFSYPLPILGLITSLVVALPAFGHPTPAEEATEAPTGTLPPRSAAEIADDWIRPADITDRADSLTRLINQRQTDSTVLEAIDKIEADITRTDPALGDAYQKAKIATSGQHSLMAIQDARRGLEAAAAPFDDWSTRVEDEARLASDTMSELDEAEARWKRTLNRPEIAEAGQAVKRRVELSLTAIQKAYKDLHDWRVRLLAINDRILDRTSSVDNALGKLEEATLARGASLLVPTHKPIWQRNLTDQIAYEIPQIGASFSEFHRETRHYFARDARPFLLQVLIALILMLAMRKLPEAAQLRIGKSNVSTGTLRVLARPYAIALFLALLVTPSMHPTAPHRVVQMITLIALFPVARILALANERSSLSLYVGLLILLMVDRLAIALGQLTAVSLLVFLLELVMASLLALEYRRRLRASKGSPLAIRLLGVGLVGIAVAIVAEIGGWSSLGQLLGRGVLVAGTAAVYSYAAVIALEALFAYALASPALRRSRFIDRNQPMVQRWSSNSIRFIGVVYWVRMVTSSMGLQQAVLEGIEAVLGAGLSVGALSVSVGGVLSFVFTLVVAVFFKRFVDEVLEDEIFPRARLPRGIPHALMALTNYAIYSIGFLLALAAAGVQLGQLSIMLGGLGVGIGLGLQDVVKNFAAGITILLERRVHVGDAVQIPDQNVFGRVLSIGIRASVVRNWNGTEVIMPNDNIVAGTVTNWTLSDASHRLEVLVGVAYGTDPQKVLDLLKKVADADERILKQPPPSALFAGFGDSSLDFKLRAWTDEGYETAAQQTSRLGVAVHQALAEAGITIPFPQRDLHLATISENVESALRSSPERSA